ncbi:response regulator [Telmatospirillum sp. J64-1]|uniref:response regulator n=1 Tax=Telmatospirillum sp. J64-1 TaxID=2502183 RepID=UPI00163DBA51|nr:response regulator [Telmatospirillum sp. J64-1]
MKTKPETTVLVVEDDDITRMLLESLLTSEGYGVHTAGDATTALAVALGKNVDVVITDISLPDDDGFALVNKIQSQRPVQAIALTGHMLEEDDFRKGGFADWLLKPVDFDDLLRRVSALASNA